MIGAADSIGGPNSNDWVKGSPVVKATGAAAPAAD